MGTREDVRTVKIESPATLDDLRWMVNQCTDLDGSVPVEILIRLDPDDGYQPDPKVTPSIQVRGTPPDKPKKVYRGTLPSSLSTRGSGPGTLPSEEDRTERRW